MRQILAREILTLAGKICSWLGVLDSNEVAKTPQLGFHKVVVVVVVVVIVVVADYDW